MKIVLIYLYTYNDYNDDDDSIHYAYALQILHIAFIRAEESCVPTPATVVLCTEMWVDSINGVYYNYTMLIIMVSFHVEFLQSNLFMKISFIIGLSLDLFSFAK